LNALKMIFSIKKTNFLGFMKNIWVPIYLFVFYFTFGESVTPREMGILQLLHQKCVECRSGPDAPEECTLFNFKRQQRSPLSRPLHYKFHTGIDR
jgi:hypothetical protein